MGNAISDDEMKINEYLMVIQERILAPIQKTEIREFCTATLLLLFAAIDGLGKLIHPNARAGSNERIRSFLDYMGGDYSICKKELLELRHSLVHNAINVESFLSHTEMSTDQHLKKTGAAGFIYVNTMTMYRDFVDAFQRFRIEIQHDQGKLQRSSNRLEWREDNFWNSQDFTDMAIPSLPPSVEFIYAK
jgi:hypothetical protein